ncbi:unnamed protein product [Prunus armeniaca]|uniref:Uncharacterized protein n=1 Tax=Prunus armeniaca TaxID=36596 RepID=A0A6J5U4U7_PRUAR|nr:unnamed protein product [Prunus armeniaca]
MMKVLWKWNPQTGRHDCTFTGSQDTLPISGLPPSIFYNTLPARISPKYQLSSSNQHQNRPPCKNSSRGLVGFSFVFPDNPLHKFKNQTWFTKLLMGLQFFSTFQWALSIIQASHTTTTTSLNQSKLKPTHLRKQTPTTSPSAATPTKHKYPAAAPTPDLDSPPAPPAEAPGVASLEASTPGPSVADDQQARRRFRQ